MFADANHHRDSNVRWTHRIYPDRMWEANLYHFYIKVYNRLIQVLPHPIMIKDGIQQEETPAHDAIREALINCIIRHYRIFCVNGKYGIQVEFRIFYFIALQNEEDYERKESSSA